MVVFGPVLGAAESLKVLYFEYPPYYHQLPDGQPAGLIVDLAKRIFARAGVGTQFEYIPPKRIVHSIQTGQPVASLGWFKTPEREAFAQFSLPVYINKPVELMFLRKNEERFRLYETLEALVGSQQFLVGRVSGFSDGPYIDGLMARFPGQVVDVPRDSVRLMAMLRAGRIDYALFPPEEVGALLTATGVSSSELMLKAMRDIPAGNTRFIMYSKTVSQDLVRRIDDAIVAEIGRLESEAQDSP